MPPARTPFEERRIRKVRQGHGVLRRDTACIGDGAAGCNPHDARCSGNPDAAASGGHGRPGVDQGQGESAGRRYAPTAPRTRASTSFTQRSRLSFSITGTPCSSAQATMYFWIRRICAKCSA